MAASGIDWPEGSTYWVTGDGRLAVICDPVAGMQSEDGTWEFVTPSQVRDNGTLVPRERFEELVANTEQLKRRPPSA